jgi:hypothetical protein
LTVIKALAFACPKTFTRCHKVVYHKYPAVENSG